MDFTTLVSSRDTDGSIRNYVNYARLPSAQILTSAEAWIYQRLRTREMKATDTGTISSGSTIAVPARLRQPIHFMFTGVNHAEVTLKTEDVVREAFTYDGDGNRVTGKPQMYAIDGTNLFFEVSVDQAYTYDFMYYQALAALSSTNTTNFLTDRYPTLLQAACMFKAYEFTRNGPGRSYWLQIARDEIREANVDSDLEISTAEIDVMIGA